MVRALFSVLFLLAFVTQSVTGGRICTQTSHAETTTGEDAVRITAEVGGALIGAGTAVLFGMAMFLIADPSGDLDSLGAGIIMALVSVVAAVFLVPAGLYLGGEWTGGDSNYWVTLSGILGGAATSGLIITLFEPEGIWVAALIGVLVIGAGVLAYELANDPNQGPVTDSSNLLLSPRNGVASPFVVPIDGGAILGGGVPF